MKIINVKPPLPGATMFSAKKADYLYSHQTMRDLRESPARVKLDGGGMGTRRRPDMFAATLHELGDTIDYYCGR